MKKTTIKEVFESDSWIITEIMQGHNNLVRVSAKRRFPKNNLSSFYNEWCTEKYANTLARENYGKNINDFGTYKY
jgi:L-cysteine desulfidase